MAPGRSFGETVAVGLGMVGAVGVTLELLTFMLGNVKWGCGRVAWKGAMSGWEPDAAVNG